MEAEKNELFKRLASTKEILKQDPDVGLQIIKEIIEQSEHLDLESRSKFYLSAVSILLSTNMLEEGYSYTHQGIIIAESGGLMNVLMEMYIHQGFYFYKKSDFVSALDKYVKVQEMAEETNNTEMLSKTYNNIAATYYNLQDTERLEEYWLKSIELKEKIGLFQEIGSVYNNLGSLYVRQGNNEKAIEYCKRSLEYKKKYNNSETIDIVLNNLAGIYLNMENYTEAYKYMYEALELSRKNNQLELEAFLLNNLASIKIKEKQFKDALSLALEAQEKAKNANDMTIRLQIYLNLTDCYNEMEDYYNAFSYRDKASKLSEELFNKRKLLEIKKLREELESEQMQKELIIRKETEEQLKRSNEKYQLLFDNELRGVISVEDKKPVMVNKTMQSMTGMTEEEIKETELNSLFIRDGIPMNYFEMITAQDIEAELLHKEKKEKLAVEVSAAKIIHEGKNSYVIFVTDTTKKKIIEQQKMEKEKLQTLVELAGAVSHELNQPLQIALGNIELLTTKKITTDKDREDFNQKLQKMKENLQRMEEITFKLKSLSAYKTRQYVGKGNIIDLNESSKVHYED